MLRALGDCLCGKAKGCHPLPDSHPSAASDMLLQMFSGQTRFRLQNISRWVVLQKSRAACSMVAELHLTVYGRCTSPQTLATLCCCQPLNDNLMLLLSMTSLICMTKANEIAQFQPRNLLRSARCYKARLVVVRRLQNNHLPVMCVASAEPDQLDTLPGTVVSLKVCAR